MGYSSEKVLSFCSQKNISCTKEAAERFDTLYDRLIAFNAHTNVTALKTEEAIVSRHFLDSLYPLAYGLIPQKASVIDIGCGAGFPGMPLKIMRDDITLSLVDSTAKKLAFPKECAELFGWTLSVFPERAEELVGKGLRETYDVAVSRAVATLPVLCELCLPFVKVGGCFIAYKSQKESDVTCPDSELSLSAKAIPALGGQLEDVWSAPLEESDGVSEHALIVIRKKARTNPIYPRRYAAILKKPLK